jgi:hypothetical protein
MHIIGFAQQGSGYCKGTGIPAKVLSSRQPTRLGLPSALNTVAPGIFLAAGSLTEEILGKPHPKENSANAQDTAESGRSWHRQVQESKDSP